MKPDAAVNIKPLEQYIVKHKMPLLQGHCMQNQNLKLKFL